MPTACFRCVTAILAFACLLCAAANVRAQVPLKFDFGPGKVREGYKQVLPTTLYTKELGYGFEPGAQVTCVDHGGDALRGDSCTSSAPFYFSVALPEGNYDVT